MDAADQIPIIVPDQFSDSASCTISVWFVEEGESVRQNERLYELLIPGMSVEIVAAQSGTLVEVVHYRNATVEAGDIIGWVLPNTNQLMPK